MAENSEKETASTSEDKSDDELDTLLDSALGDFSEVPSNKPTENKTNASPNAPSAEEETEKMWAEMIKQALQVDPNIRDMFAAGSSEESNFVQDFTKIAEAAAKVIESDSAPANFTDIMSETLKNLKESSENLQNQFGTPEELSGLFQELGLGVGEGNFEDIPPFMQNIMQTFLSKDALYPSIKDFVERYPAWLEEHKESLPAEQYENYCKQLELMKKLLEEFEAETETDSEEVKKERFQRIMGYMQQMQALGQPPAELLGTDVPLDAASLPPGMDPNQCSLM